MTTHNRLTNTELPPSNRWQVTGRWLGSAGIASIAIGFSASTAAVNIGLILLLLGILPEIRGLLRSTPPAAVIIAILQSTVLIIITVVANVRFPELSDHNWKHLEDLLIISGIPAVAVGWWLAHGGITYPAILGLLSIGTGIKSIGTINWDAVIATPFLGRPLITAINPNELAFISGALLVGIASLLISGNCTQNKSPLWRFVVIAAFSAIALCAGYLVVIAQSRAVVLGVLATLCFIAGARMWHTRKSAKGRRQTIVLLTVLVAILCVISLSPLGKMATQRFGKLGANIQTLMDNDLDSISSNSEGIRLLLWREGLSHLPDAMILGHGPGAAPHIIAQSTVPSLRHFNHFHNIWIHWLVTIGVLGTLGFAILFWKLLAISFQEAFSRAGGVCWPAAGLWIYFLIVSAAQLRINHPSGQAFLVLLSGMSYAAVYLRAPQPVTE
ncbi:MAG: O-antigen ligase family protein [Gammaproteobacteria bacterium]|nr:O-antigen ligase family protein [Gammaproteobacteria bacterium]